MHLMSVNGRKVDDLCGRDSRVKTYARVLRNRVHVRLCIMYGVRVDKRRTALHFAVFP